MGKTEQKDIEVIIISLDKVKVGKVCYPSGWGEKSTEVHVGGKVAQIDIDYKNKLYFSLRIFDDGSIHINTDCMGMMAPRDFRLTNERSWRELEAKS